MASEIRVNKIENRSGLGTVTFADTGVDLAGIVTATTFSGSGASLTGLPAAQLSGTLPAISAANLTNVPAANITGTLPAISAANLTNVPAANVTGTLPAISGANLTNLTAANLTGALPAISAANCTQIPAANIVGVCTAGFERTGGFGGITMADQWRVNSGFNSQNEDLKYNWERVDTNFAQIGTGMSYDSSTGYFTFPTTGIYRVDFYATMYRSSNDTRYMGVSMWLSTNSGTGFSERAQSYGSVSNNSTAYTNCALSAIFDVTDESVTRLKFMSDSVTTITYDGSSDSNRTFVTIVRLGDT